MPPYSCVLPQYLAELLSQFSYSSLLLLKATQPVREIKHRKSCEKLPWELVGCQGVQVFLLKDVIITTSVTTVIFITITIWVFELSQFNFFSFAQFEFLSLVTIWSFKFCQKFFLVLSVWVLEFCHSLSFF